MKKSNLLLSLLMAVTFIAFTTSCSEDPVVPPSTGLPVADGFYITKSGVDPVATSKLNAEVVEDDGFSSQSRDGFVASYLYLDAGEYTIVEVVTKAITETLGGTVADSVLTSDCGAQGYRSRRRQI